MPVRISPYRQAQLEARAAAGSLSDAAARKIEEALRHYAKRLAWKIAALPADQQRALEGARVAITAAADELARAVQVAVAGQRVATFSQVEAIWQTAARAAVRGLSSLPAALVGGVPVPGITLAGAYEGLGGAARTWQTALQGYIRGAAQEADLLVRTALLQGISPAQLSRALRPYVAGAAPFHQAFGAEAFTKLRDLRASNVPPDLRDAAKKLQYQADRIAYSEIWNARAEAELQHFATDPLIEAVQWTLSPFRGAIDGPDVCDALAINDFYGLGPGVYPLDAVPPPPHPFDRCSREPVIRSPDQAHLPKPSPALQLEPGQARLYERGRGYTPDRRDPRTGRQVIVTQAQAARQRQQLEGLLSFGRSGHAAQGMRELMVVGQQEAARLFAAGI